MALMCVASHCNQSKGALLAERSPRVPSSPAGGLKGRAVVGDHPTPNRNRIGLRKYDGFSSQTRLIGL